MDLSAEMGWEYMLIDAGWQNMGNGGTMEDVVKYAQQKGVGVWLWYHSGAGREKDSVSTHRLMSDPELRRAEMKRISEVGVKGIKVDFFDTDKQRIIQLYPALLKDAADNHLLVDLHGATLPRGFERTYPNMLTTEAIRGAETLGRQEPAAWDESLLLAGYPADYAVVARRSGDVWYIGGISGKEEEREIEFTLPAGCEGKSFTMIIDGKDKDSFDYMPVENTNGTVKVKVLPNGGFAGMIR